MPQRKGGKKDRGREEEARNVEEAVWHGLEVDRLPFSSISIYICRQLRKMIAQINHN